MLNYSLTCLPFFAPLSPSIPTFLPLTTHSSLMDSLYRYRLFSAVPFIILPSLSNAHHFLCSHLLFTLSCPYSPFSFQRSLHLPIHHSIPSLSYPYHPSDTTPPHILLNKHLNSLILPLSSVSVSPYPTLFFLFFLSLNSKLVCVPSFSISLHHSVNLSPFTERFSASLILQFSASLSLPSFLASHILSVTLLYIPQTGRGTSTSRLSHLRLRGHHPLDAQP